MFSLKKPNRGDNSIDLDNFCHLVDLVEMVANAQYDQNFQVSRSGKTMQVGLIPGEGRSTISYSDWAFGFSINGAVVTVNSGKVRHGTRTAVIAAGKDIIIATDQTWVFVSYTYGGSATITSSTSEPKDTEEVHNHALFLVTLTSGVASVEKGNIKSLGDIFIPSVFA